MIDFLKVFETCEKKMEIHMKTFNSKPYEYAACKNGSYEKESNRRKA